MKNKPRNGFVLEIIAALILIALLTLLADPYDFFMPTMIVQIIAGIAVVVFGILAGLLLKEHAGDEREEKHICLAGRVAFLAGSSVLLLGIIMQVLSDKLDIWLVIALVVMVVGKVGTRIYSDHYN